MTVLRVALPVAPYVIRTDVAELEVGRTTMRHLPWAVAEGRDRFGLWADFTAGDVRTRMRWIPPGRFLMGSPEDEPGRDHSEGPRFEITHKHGFWLMDTPVTQALWVEVMAEDPSAFQDPERPVEQVSWDDTNGFFQALNRRVPGLDLRLPSEAEWECACRAGTDTATYAGPIEILGLNSAPVLDLIAWYAGNSGVGFDLEEGVTALWSETQHDFKTSGTRKVKQKTPNAWGLYDTLGNVLEWCEDAWSNDYVGASPDGSARSASQKNGARVIRGGSWSDSAQFVRAACRSGGMPYHRDFFLGFRAARGQVSSSKLAGQRDASSAGAAEPPAEERDLAGSAYSRTEAYDQPDRKDQNDLSATGQDFFRGESRDDGRFTTNPSTRD